MSKVACVGLTVDRRAKRAAASITSHAIQRSDAHMTQHAWRPLPLAALVLVAATACNKANKVEATSIDCGDEALRCIECDPGALDCDGASLIRCKDDGMGFVLASECPSAQLCIAGLESGAADCAAPTCQADEADCIGPVMRICAAGRNAFDLVACQSDDACLRGLAARRCAETECSEANDCAGQDTQCRRRVCLEGRCDTENLPAETACVIREVNGACDGEGACVPLEDDACTIADDCPGADTACRIRACVGGQCGFAHTPDSTPCTAGDLRGGCDGGGSCIPVADCNSAIACPGDDTQCAIRACVTGACGFADLPASTDCDVDGIPGACDGAGACMAGECAIADDCPGIDSDCRIRACDEGVCGFDVMPVDLPCSVDGLGGICDGVGGCTITQQCRTANECAAQANPCRTPRCTEGRCGTTSVSGACPMGQSIGECRGGSCACPNPLQFCGDRCVDTRSDIENCSGCGRRCNAAGGEICESGCECPGEDEGTGGECGGRCIDLVEPLNCGACGVRCQPNYVCTERAQGRPACQCPDGFGVCDGACIALTTDDNCGGCGLRCPADARCNGQGACVCRAGGYQPCSPGTSTECQRYICRPLGSAEWDDNRCRGGGTIPPHLTVCGYAAECCD